MTEHEAAQRLLAPDKAVFLITVGEDGRPDARAMAVAKADGLKTAWMMTSKLSDKFKQLSQNPECMLYATDFEDDQGYMELRLWGKMELIDDAGTRAQVWRDNYACYFPDGKEDPNLGVLKFTVESGTLQTLAGKEKLSI